QNAKAHLLFDRPVGYPGGAYGGVNIVTFSLVRAFNGAPTAVDTIAMSGTLSLPDSFVPADKTLQLDVGGLGWAFSTFSKKGIAIASDSTASKATGTFNMHYDARKHIWIFSSSLRR